MNTKTVYYDELISNSSEPNYYTIIFTDAIDGEKVAIEGVNYFQISPPILKGVGLRTLRLNTVECDNLEYSSDGDIFITYEIGGITNDELI